MAIRARVHGCHEGEAGGIGIGGRGPGERHDALLQGLAEGFQGIAAELDRSAAIGTDDAALKEDTFLPPPNRR